MPNITKKEIGVAKTPKARKPDYYWWDGYVRKPGYYNEGVDTYDVLVDGEFYCAVQIPFDTMSDEAEKKVIDRAKNMCPPLKNIPQDSISLKFVSSIPPLHGIRKKKVQKEDIRGTGIRRSMEHIKHIKHRDIITVNYKPVGFVKVKPNIVEEVPKEEPIEQVDDVQIVAIRKIDGRIETHGLKDFKFKFITSHGKVMECLEHNATSLSRGIINIRRYKQVGRRYIFPVECLKEINDLDIAHLLRREDFTDADIAVMLRKEAANYALRRADYNKKCRESKKAKRMANRSISKSNSDIASE